MWENKRFIYGNRTFISQFILKNFASKFSCHSYFAVCKDNHCCSFDHTRDYVETVLLHSDVCCDDTLVFLSTIAEWTLVFIKLISMLASINWCYFDDGFDRNRSVLGKTKREISWKIKTSPDKTLSTFTTR